LSAYQNPIRIRPSNSNLAPFTIGAGQQVEVDINQIGSTKATGETAQIPTGSTGTQTSSSPKIPAGVPNSGLIAYYSFDDGTARDNSGNGNDGQLQGGASIVSGKIGEAVSLDGISGSVNIHKTPAFNPGDQMTDFFTNTGGSFNHTSDLIGGGSPVSSGQWHHVAGVYDGSRMDLGCFCKLYNNLDKYRRRYIHYQNVL
jgi:hypothetical protein